MSLNINELQRHFPKAGIVEEILVRPEKYAEPLSKQNVAVTQENGLEGDHYTGGSTRKRQVTLIQKEHLPAIASMLNRSEIVASMLRRNIVVSGINLLALKDCVFSIGTAHLKMTGLCHPCSRMEKALGPGGYNAMRGHGGINATVIRDGQISVGDPVEIIKLSNGKS